MKLEHTLNYKPFKPLEGPKAEHELGNDAPGSVQLQHIEGLIQEGKYPDALARLSELINTTLQGTVKDSSE